MPEVRAASGIDSGSALSYHRAASGSIKDGEIAGGAMALGEGQVGLKKPGATEPPKDGVSTAALRVALLYDMDACYAPTGVTRHALAQLERLARRPEIALTVLTGRMSHPDGLAYWESLELPSRRELPLRTRDLLRWWRIKPWPPIEWWTGPLDWIYCPAEFFVPTRQAQKAVTSHDVLQLLRYEPPASASRWPGSSSGPTWSCRFRVSTPSSCWRPFPPAEVGWRTCPTPPMSCSSSPPRHTNESESATTWGSRRECRTCYRSPTSSRGRTWCGWSRRLPGYPRWRRASWRW